jgi:hypothetical protein
VDVQSAARRWAETWQRAWPAKQAAEIAALYHEAARYRSSPFREPEAGGALAFVARQFAIEDDVECWFGEPICAGDRAAVEWRASFIETGQAITLAGAFWKPGGRRNGQSSRACRSRPWHTNGGSCSSTDQETPTDSRRTASAVIAADW